MSLFVVRYPSTNSEIKTECVLIHGWGASSSIWTLWLTVIREHCNVTLIDLPGYGESDVMDYNNRNNLLRQCVKNLPPRAVYIGYSLGGMLALNIAKQFPQRVQAVITMGSNLKFVADEQWRHAMPKKTFEVFSTGVKNNLNKTLKRFMALQISGGKQEIFLLKILRANKLESSGDALAQSLKLLADLDNRTLMNTMQTPVLQMFGENDHLVPVALADELKEQEGKNIVIMDGAPHCLFISNPKKTWSYIHEFLKREKIITGTAPRLLDKKQIARSFSRAAISYDSVADLQREVGHHLCQYLPECSADVVMDLGCGTGFFSASFQQRYKNCHTVALDLAEGMVNYASQHHREKNISWLCGDAENIPLSDNSVDIVFSSLAIQWCEDSDGLFAELARVLKPGGSFVVSTLGPNTLHELRDAWLAVDDYTHVNRFVEQNQLLLSAQQAGLSSALDSVTGFDEKTITLEYDTLKKLTRELKSLGAHNINSGRLSGLMGKQRVRQFKKAYERQRNKQDLLPASYQVWFSVWRKA
ncbi:MAG: malonyl-ACP O-methyltransferase BioC [Spongiibacteraceae bacterium]|nr:malonyl-ACP O-methyltransferase BioC [Spongiibacteraceae bacterium]